MKKLILIALLAIILPTVSYCSTTEENISDSMGRAYKAASEKNMDQAKSYFIKAMQYAEQAGSWQGLLDSGYGLSTLGDAEKARAAFDKAMPLAQKAGDWHSTVALGYAYSSLPQQVETTNIAVRMWTEAMNWAGKEGSALGLLEAGRGFMSINDNQQAEQCFDSAREIIKQAPTERAIKILVQAYRKLGREDKAMDCAAYKIPEDTPPPGWTPTAGETIRKPKTVSQSAQLAQRNSADMDIAAKRNWEQEQALIKQQEGMQKQELAYLAYQDSMRFYSYPYYGEYGGFIYNNDDFYFGAWYGRPIWTERTYDEIDNWALWNMGRYSYVDGFYIEVDIY